MKIENFDMKFTIYTPRFNERGGVLALYNLCRLLNEAGYPSAVWPSDKKLHGSLEIRQAISIERQNKLVSESSSTHCTEK
jgi:hypothetical protein